MSDQENRVSLALVPIVGLAFATTSLSWSLFNNIIPIFLKENYGIKLAFVGFIMTWDNIIAFFVQPWIGSRSDATRTRIGRRMPYIIPGIILGSIFFYLIYLASFEALFIFLGTIVIFNLSMALYRSPAVSLMPDLISSKDRSVGNAIVNLMGGMFAGISLLVGGGLLKAGNTEGAFLLVTGGMLVSLFILLLVIREPPILENQEIEIKPSALQILRRESRRMLQDEDKSLLFMLTAILSWFVAWNALEAFYSTYVHNVFLPELDGEKAAGVASGLMFYFSVSFIALSLLGGYLGKRLGRKKTMRMGLLIMILSITISAFVQENSILGLSLPWETSFTYIFLLAGMGWGLVNINSIVVVWELSVDNGTGTGMYYAFSSAAAILGPSLAGLLMDIQVRFLFPFSITFLIMAFIFLMLVRSGETGEGTHHQNAIEELMD